jgi:hypothetical protein
LWLRRNLLRDERAKPQLKREPCARDYCALYHTDVLRENKLSFITRGGYSAGEVLHYALKKLGYQTSLIPVREMMGMMDHIAHATGAIVPELKHARNRTVNKAQRRLKSLFNRNDVTDLMNAESLDKLA